MDHPKSNLIDGTAAGFSASQHWFVGRPKN